MNTQVHILGAGGHAAVLIATLEAKGFTVAAIYDDNPDLLNTTIMNVPVRGKVCDLPRDFSGPAAVGIGDNITRHTIVNMFPDCQWVSAVHPSAVVDPSATIGIGTVVFAGVVVQPRSVIGNHVILNTGCSVDHDCVVGDFCHLAPGVRLAGIVTVEEGVFMGIASSTIPQTKVGAWSTVGAGGVVIRDLPPRVTAVGVPVRIIKRHPDWSDNTSLINS